MLALGVDVPAEEAVAHVVGARLRAVVPLASQVLDRVRGGDEAGVRREVQVEELPERVHPVVEPRARQLVVRAPAPPPEVQRVREGLSEVIHAQRSGDFIR